MPTTVKHYRVFRSVPTDIMPFYDLYHYLSDRNAGDLLLINGD